MCGVSDLENKLTSVNFEQMTVSLAFVAAGQVIRPTSGLAQLNPLCRHMDLQIRFRAAHNREVIMLLDQLEEVLRFEFVYAKI